jgi:hypothetical protein
MKIKASQIQKQTVKVSLILNNIILYRESLWQRSLRTAQQGSWTQCRLARKVNYHKNHCSFMKHSEIFQNK